jgi:hypothetical protein
MNRALQTFGALIPAILLQKKHYEKENLQYGFSKDNGNCMFI